jgi:hypothetical protein
MPPIRALLRLNLRAASRRIHSRPAPPPLADKTDRAIFRESVSASERSDALAQALNTNDGTSHPDARTSLPSEFEGDVNPLTGEQGGPKREPTKHGDWEHAGRVSDF